MAMKQRADTDLPHRVVTIGHLSMDHHILVESIPGPNQDAFVIDSSNQPGGAAANVAAAIAAGKFPAAIATLIADDDPGLLLSEDMNQHGVDTDLIMTETGGRSSRLLVVKDPTGARSFYLDLTGASFKLAASDLVKNLRANDVVAFAGCALELAANICELCPNLMKVANVGFWIASGEDENPRFTASILSRLDILFANRTEFFGLDPSIRDYLLNSWLVGDRQILVTDGANPTSIFHAGAELTVDVAPIETVVDTIGCGDAFMGGYLAEYFRGGSKTDSCVVGHRLAGLVAASLTERVQPATTRDTSS